MIDLWFLKSFKLVMTSYPCRRKVIFCGEKLKKISQEPSTRILKDLVIFQTSGTFCLYYFEFSMKKFPI